MPAPALSPRDRQLARRLASLAAEAGEQAWNDLKPALDKAMDGAGAHRRRHFLVAVRAQLVREQAKRTAAIEHGGKIDPQAVEDIRRHFSQSTGRTLQAKTRENPALIAGVRVTVGDNVYDASVAGRLAALEKAVR